MIMVNENSPCEPSRTDDSFCIVQLYIYYFFVFGEIDVLSSLFVS